VFYIQWLYYYNLIRSNKHFLKDTSTTTFVNLLSTKNELVMKNKRELFIPCFSFLFMILILQIKVEAQEFQINHKDQVTFVSSSDLNFSIHIRKPESIPQSSDPVNWKVKNETTISKSLAGYNGQLNSITYSNNIGLLNCQTWISERKDLIAFRQTFTNTSEKPVILKNLYPLFIDGKDPFKFGTISDWRILTQYRHKQQVPAVEVPAAEKTFNCDPFFIINNNKTNNNGTGKNLFIGFQTFYHHLSEISVSFDSNTQLDKIAANCDFEGVELPKNGNRVSQWVILSQGNDANSLMTDYAKRVRSFHNIKMPPKNAPTVYSTWYYHTLYYNENIFIGDIGQFKKEHLPFDVFLLDECWDINDWGDFEANNQFPKGMKWVAQQISLIGYIPGIWTAPFLIDGESDLARDHPAWLLKNSKGKQCNFKMNGRNHFILDLTYPGACNYLEKQFRKISHDWGYKYFKLDFLRCVFNDTDQQFYDKTSTSLEAYRKGLEAIRRGVGNEVYISACGGHFGSSLGIADSQRSGSDVTSSWGDNELPKYKQNILRTWMSDLWHVDPDAMMVRRQKNEIPYKYINHSPGSSTDEEAFTQKNLTRGLFTDEEAFTNSINQFIGGNLITFTEDFAVIDQDRKMLYKHVIPSVNSTSRPIDPFNTNIPELMVTHISPKCSKLGVWNMLTIVNWSNESKDYQIILDQNLTSNLMGEKFMIFDFQSQKILAYLEKGEVLDIKDIKGHNSKLLKIIAWDGKSAMFIGTDLNFACGGLEISDIKYEEGKVSGVLETDWSVPVILTFVVPAIDGYGLRKLEMGEGQKRFAIDF